MQVTDSAGVQQDRGIIQEATAAKIRIFGRKNLESEWDYIANVESLQTKSAQLQDTLEEQTDGLGVLQYSCVSHAAEIPRRSLRLVVPVG